LHAMSCHAFHGCSPFDVGLSVSLQPVFRPADGS
jgi:hypothetical protein